MKKELLEMLVRWPKYFLTGTDLATLLDKSYDSRHAIIKRAVREGFLIKVQNDLYLIKPTLRQVLPNTFELAQFIWGPSYISYESALSFHGWIPEAVHVTASACSKKGKKVTTPVGIFSFERIPVDAFSMGLHQHTNDACFLIAQGWKAIADMIYSRRKEWPNLRALQGDLRIEDEKLLESDKALLQYLVQNYPSLRTRKFLERLF